MEASYRYWKFDIVSAINGLQYFPQVLTLLLTVWLVTYWICLILDMWSSVNVVDRANEIHYTVHYSDEILYYIIHNTMLRASVTRSADCFKQIFSFGETASHLRVCRCVRFSSMSFSRLSSCCMFSTMKPILLLKSAYLLGLPLNSGKSTKSST